jgi:hypothetical protein
MSSSSTSTTWSPSGAMRSVDGREVALARGVEEAIHHARAVRGRQVDRKAFLCRSGLDGREHRRQVHVLGVDAIHDDEPAQAALGRPVHHALAIICTPLAALITTAAVSTASSAPIDLGR